MEWNKSFAIGVDLIDSQHCELFRILNQLQQAISTGESRAVLGSTIKALAEYTIYHFSQEESLMLAIRYPEYLKHQDIHKSLIAEVRGVLLRIKNHQDINAREIFQFLHKWVTNHIMTEDMKVSRFVFMNKSILANHLDSFNILGATGAKLTAGLQSVKERLHKKDLTPDLVVTAQMKALAETLSMYLSCDEFEFPPVMRYLNSLVKMELITGLQSAECKKQLFSTISLRSAMSKQMPPERVKAFFEALKKESFITEEECLLYHVETE